eukprot:355947-Chlamydomonas_euryale.AAC.15
MNDTSWACCTYTSACRGGTRRRHFCCNGHVATINTIQYALQLATRRQGMSSRSSALCMGEREGSGEVKSQTRSQRQHESSQVHLSGGMKAYTGQVFSVLLRTFELERKSCSTLIAGASSRAVTCFSAQIARAASKMTISVLWRRHDSRKS